MGMARKPLTAIIYVRGPYGIDLTDPRLDPHASTSVTPRTGVGDGLCRSFWYVRTGISALHVRGK